MHKAIENYIRLIENNAFAFCEEQKALAAHVRDCFANERLYINDEQLEKYLGISKYFSFEALFPWEEFETALWLCTYEEDRKTPRWKTAFNMVGRGAGKDGFIAFASTCLISPYNKVGHYNVDICANNEEQAVTPVKDISEMLESPKYEQKLKRFYYHTKELVQGRQNKGIIKGHTNNPKGRDGLRSGAVIFNEIHQFQNYDNIKVFVTGQGKVAQPRVGLFTSNGIVSDGPLDDYLARGRRILFEGEKDEGFLPFICCLNNKDQVHDKANWDMANPSLPYLPHLRHEIEDEYRDWCEHPEQNGDFITKRMGLREGFAELAVTDYEKITRTAREIPNLRGKTCVAGIDYAELSDMASVTLHFKIDNQRYDINHSWLCLQSKDITRIKAPYRDWANKDLITLVDDVSIHPDLIAEYIRAAAQDYNIIGIACDGFRWTLLSESLKKIGFDPKDRKNVKLVRPSDIMQVEPVIQECFDRDLFTWGDNPVLRWATNNTKRVKSSRKYIDVGNYVYAKIEAKSRKTDPFMSLVAAMCMEGEAEVKNIVLPPIGAISFNF